MWIALSVFCTSQTEKFTCNYVRAACSYVVPHRVKYTETYIARILGCVTVQYVWLEMHNAATTFMADLLKITVYVSTTLNMLITHIQQQQQQQIRRTKMLRSRKFGFMIFNPKCLFLHTATKTRQVTFVQRWSKVNEPSESKIHISKKFSSHPSTNTLPLQKMVKAKIVVTTHIHCT